MADEVTSPRITFCAFDKPGNIGGPASWLLWLMPALQKRGFKVHCLVFLHTGEDGPLTQFLVDHDISHHKTHNPATVEGSIRWILRRLQEIPTDIFIPNVVTSAFYACRWVREAGIATVGILHSDYGYCDALQTDFVAGHPAHRMSGMVGVSRELERQINSCATDQTSVYRIPYGAPIPSSRVPMPKDVFRVAFFGRLVTEQKRIQELAHAFCHLTKEVPGVEAIIYGDGPEKAEVEAILAAEGKGLSVRLGGSIPSQQVQEKMLECHVIVLLSDYEGLPIAIMEAMAGGTVPVCRFNKSGIPELIEDGVNGHIIHDDKRESLVNAIRPLVENPERWRSFSQASQEKILQEYTMDHGADLWAEALRDQVRRWRRPGKIRVPNWIFLPPENPLLPNAGYREKPVRTFLKRRIVRSRMFAGKIKRMILSTPATKA